MHILTRFEIEVQNENISADRQQEAHRLVGTDETLHRLTWNLTHWSPLCHWAITKLSKTIFKATPNIAIVHWELPNIIRVKCYRRMLGTLRRLGVMGFDWLIDCDWLRVTWILRNALLQFSASVVQRFGYPQTRENWRVINNFNIGVIKSVKHENWKIAVQNAASPTYLVTEPGQHYSVSR